MDIRKVIQVLVIISLLYQLTITQITAFLSSHLHMFHITYLYEQFIHKLDKNCLSAVTHGL